MKARSIPCLILSVLGFLDARFAAHATATASADLSFTNLSISPASGTLVLLTNWQASAYAQAGVNSQSDAGSGVRSAAAAGDYSLAQGLGAAWTPLSLNVSGKADASASVPGQISGSDTATARGAMNSYFMITGGSGQVNTTFSIGISGSLNLFTDAYGELAEAETIFAMELDGNPQLFEDHFLSIGASDSNSSIFSHPLTGSLMLDYNTPYFILLEGDAEVRVSNVPEPGTSELCLAALALAWAGSWLRNRFRRVQCSRSFAGLALITGVASLVMPGVSRASYLGSGAPDVCQKCGVPATREAGGNLNTSLSEGNLREDYAVVSVNSSMGPTLPLRLTYNSYNADGSRAQVDLGCGLGWSHSFNTVLFQQRSHMFRMDPDGRITQYRLGAGNVYTADQGYFETLTLQADGSFMVTNKNQSWWHFISVPATPYLVAGPIYRLIQFGDRNQNVTSLAYSNGLLVSVADTYGRTITFGYTNANKLSAISDPLGRVTIIQYDSLFRMPVRVTDPDGKVIRYSYNSLYQLTRKIDRDGRIFIYIYKNQKPFAVMDGSGQTIFSLANPNNWAVDRNTLAFALKRQYLPSTVTKTDGNLNTWRYSYDVNGYIISTIAPDGSTTSYTYDPLTLLVSSVTNANGAVTRYQYDLEGNRTNVTDALGNVTQYTYEPIYNQVTSMIDPNGRTTIYQYDSRGNRTNEIDPLLQTRSWGYDANGNVLTETDKRGFLTSYQYDSFGNRTNMTDALGNVTRSTYDAVGNLISTIDPLGRTTTSAYDAQDRVIAVTNTLGGVTTYTYDPMGRTIQMTDPNTNSTSYTYDSRGRLVQKTNALGGITSSRYDANDNLVIRTNEIGQATTYAYDSLNRLIRTTNALGSVTRTFYDSVGNVTNTVDPNGHATQYRYDALDRRISLTDALGNVTKYDYSTPAGPPCCSPTLGSAHVTRLEDANGKVTFYKYDALDRLVTTIRKEGDTNDVVDASDAVTAYTYDPVGNRTSVTDPIGNITTNRFDSINRLTNTVNAVGDTTSHFYDGVGNRISSIAPNGNTTVYIYDALNRRVSNQDAIGLLTTNCYDPVGNLLSTIDANGNTTSYSYDGLDRRVLQTDALGKTTTTAYDPVGNVVTNIDRNGRATTYTYDALNRQILATDALGNTNATAYDSVGNVTNLVDANGNTTRYVYDALDRRIIEIYPDPAPNSRTSAYDAVGNLTVRTDQRGQVTTYSYNDLYFLTNRQYQPSGTSDRFTYDLSHRMLSADRTGWADTYAYDGASRLTNTTQNGRMIRYTYDIPGRIRSIVYPGGRSITFTNDARDRRISVHDGTLNPSLAFYAYDGADRVVTRTYRNGVVATYTYDADNRVTSLEHMLGLTRIAGFSYDYDDEGNRRYQERRHQTTASESYAYDPVYRLTNFDVGTLSGSIVPLPVLEKKWNLDPAGNWNTVFSNGVPEVRVHNAVNELLSINATNLLAYDDNGNLQQDTFYSYSYDEENRLVQVRRLSDSAIVGQYFYDALGRRVMRIASASGTAETNFCYYDESSMIEEQDGLGATLATYTYGNYLDEVLTMDRGGQSYYYHQNSLWSPDALTDGTGAVAERYSYDAYGYPTILNAGYVPVSANAWGTPHSAVTNAYLFSGRQLDEETGLYFYRARSYDNGKGRFMQRDPSEYESGMNLYEYVRDNPINLSDPSGLQSLSIHIVAGPTPGACGEFEWRISWRLAEKSKKGGWIVQHIESEISASDCKGKGTPLPAPASRSRNFWEAWYVPPDRDRLPKREGDNLWDDKYFSTPRGLCTQGRITITGSAAFYENLALPKTFVANNEKTGAGKLRATTEDPKLTGGTEAIDHNFSAKWDCCPTSKDSKTRILGFDPQKPKK